MVKFLDQAGLSALWNKIKSAFYTKYEVYTKDEVYPKEDLYTKADLYTKTELNDIVAHEQAASLSGDLTPSGLATAVSTEQQSLTDAQKAQVQSNIGIDTYVTNALKQNVYHQACQCGYLATNTNYTITLTDTQYNVLNNTDVISMRFVFTEPENYYGVAGTLRYVAIAGSNTTSSGDYFNFRWDYSKRMTCAGLNYNTATCINRTSGGTIINPLVFTLVWNKAEGTIRYYERGNLISTQTNDAYKKTNFIASSKKITINGGDTGIYLYDVQIFDYDITHNYFATYENTIFGASYVYAKYNNNLISGQGQWLSQNPSSEAYGASGTYFTSTVSGTYRIIQSKPNTPSGQSLARGYYTGSTSKKQIWETVFEITSGECQITNSSQVILSITDSNGNSHSVGETLGVGEYTIKGVSGGVGCWNLKYISGDLYFIHKTVRYKLISCVVHLKCDEFYDGYLYDEQAQTFYNTSKTLIPSNTPFTLPRNTVTNPPNFVGQMAVTSNGGVYVGVPNYIWKQVNNS